MRIRSFRVAIAGNLLTRLGIGGLPFLLPLLYQVGLGFSPIQSGLMIMPQALAAMSFKPTLPRILRQFGYRRVLIVNTVMLGVIADAVLDDRCPARRYGSSRCRRSSTGFFTSTQYTSMNTLGYADVNQDQASGASTIASTVQQLAVSFGVASASLTRRLLHSGPCSRERRRK